MSARSPVRALAWKEARDLRMPVVGACGMLILLHWGLSWTPGGAWATALVLVVAPLAAATFGAIAVAGENADGSMAFLRSRAVGVATILRVKFVAHAVAALIVCGLAFALGRLAGFGADGWCQPLEAPASSGWMLGTLFVVTAFCWGLALSLVVPDGLTAAPAAALAGATWSALILVPALELAESGEVGLSGLAWAAPLLILPPIIVSWSLARRAPWLASGPLTRRVQLVALALGVVAGACFVKSLDEPFRAWLVRQGSASIDETSIVGDPRGGTVAFVATPEGGTPRAVVALADRRRLLSIHVLAPGTRPTGWDEKEGVFSIEWPGGVLRGVTPTGDVGPARDAAPRTNSPFEARRGSLVRSDTAVILYPPPAEQQP